jgi:predicted flap endonuclease-1-like 5' DNA nuclease
MKPSFIKGIGSSYEKKLRKADIAQAEELRHIDVESLSEKTGISTKNLKKWKKKALNIGFLSDIEGIGALTEKKLHQAGIHDSHTLLKTDIQKLETQTGINRKTLESLQEATSRLKGKPIIKAHLAKEYTEVSISPKKESLWERFKEWLKG